MYTRVGFLPGVGWGSSMCERSGAFTDVNPPKVTVLMSVYNGEAYLKASVQSVLEQTFRDFEFLVIDDGSSDGSLSILQDIHDDRVRVVQNAQNLGLIRSLNKGIGLARGEYIARHDCDDLMVRERLAHQVVYMDEHPEVVLAGTWMQLIDESDNPVDEWCNPPSDLEIRWSSLFNAAVSHPSAMYRTQLARTLKGYSSDSIYAEDFDLWSRMAEHGKVANLPAILEWYRIHGESVSKKNEERQLATRFAVASRNIAKVVGPEFFHPALMELIIQTRMPKGLAELNSLVRGYQQLVQAFEAQYVVAVALSDWIRWDIVERLSTSFQHVGWAGRMAALLLNVGAFPAAFWFRGRFLSFVMSHELKRSLARRLGRE